MDDIVVIDDFLLPDLFNKIRNNILEQGMLPFFHFPYKVDVGDNYNQFSSIIYQNSKPEIPLELFGKFESIFKTMNVCALIKAKFNLTLPRIKNEVFGIHTDTNIRNSYTGILYFSNTDGETVFDTGEKIECVRNRFVYFPSYMAHSGISHTFDSEDTERLVLNVNYFSPKS